MTKPIAKTKNNSELDEVLEKLINTGIIFLTKDNVVEQALLGKESSVEKYAYARKRLRDEQRTEVPKIKKAILSKYISKKEVLGLIKSQPTWEKSTMIDAEALIEQIEGLK